MRMRPIAIDSKGISLATLMHPQREIEGESEQEYKY
jgi:hypothetical protein